MNNLLKLTFLLTIFISFHLNTIGQKQFGLKAGVGLSRITDSMESSNVNQTTPFVPSGQGGIYYNLSLGKKSSLGAELLFSRVEAKEKWEASLTDENGRNIGHATALFYKHISYLSLPVYYGFNLKKLTINAGFQVSRVLASSGREKNDATINEENVVPYNYDRKVDHINITNFDFGPKAGILYHLTDKLAIEGTYYYTLDNVDSRVPKVGKWKVHQMTLGARYALSSK